MLTRPTLILAGLTTSASVALGLPSTLRFPVDSLGPQSTLSSLDIDTPEHTVSSQGPYAPYLAQTSYLPRSTPEGWTVDQAHVLMRHGARFPTKNAAKRIDASLSKLANRTSIADPQLAFVEGYTFANFTPDMLSDFGRKECFDAGVQFRKTYADLAIEDGGAFVRAASDARVVESAGWFLEGWKGRDFVLNTTLAAPDVIISEDDGMNNTLSVSTCAADEDLDPNYGDVARENWQGAFLWASAHFTLSVYAPSILARLEAALPGTNLTADDLNNIMSLCGFESQRNLEWAESPWCAVFARDEWKQHEYFYDLDKFYAHGYGSPYAQVSGIGYVNELIARLSSSSVLAGASVNTTLDAPGAATFPLNRTVYVDFSHDNNMVGVLAALGVLREEDGDLRSAPGATDIPAHKFVVSSLVPFAGRFVIERLLAPSGEHYVRLLLNDAVVPLSIAGCDRALGEKYGLCELGGFVSGREAEKITDDWRICAEDPVQREVPL